MFSEFNTIFCIDVSIGFKSKILMSNFFCFYYKSSICNRCMDHSCPHVWKNTHVGAPMPSWTSKRYGRQQKKDSVLTFKDDTIFYI